MGRELFWVTLAVAACAACTKQNPAAFCGPSGECSDPAFPFCDVDGVIGGTPGTCIAVSCTAGEVGGCDGSSALVCSGSGDGFVAQTCVNGCDVTAGCVACVANQTSCVGGTLSTCDGSGTVTSSTACSIGCSADSTRCLTMVPSNGLAAQLATVPAPPDLDFENGALDLTKSTFTPTGGSAIAVSLIDLDAPDGGQELEVLVAHTLTLNNVVIFASSQTRPNLALAVIATSDVTIMATNAVHLAGYVDDEQCAGGPFRTGSAGSFTNTTGGGGGGFGTVGGDGGSIGAVHGGVGGAVSGNETLVPLRGGCDGGHRTTREAFAEGGGEVQLSSLTTIVVNGTIQVDAGNPFDTAGAGGGAGGAILLEAPTVSLSADGALLARGTGGAAGDGTDGVTHDDSLSDPGGLCQGASSQITCSNGGSGASPAEAAQNGAEFTGATGASNVATGGGGGGLGRIRINTATGMFTPGANSLVAGALTVGTLASQ